MMRYLVVLLLMGCGGVDDSCLYQSKTFHFSRCDPQSWQTIDYDLGDSLQCGSYEGGSYHVGRGGAYFVSAEIRPDADVVGTVQTRCIIGDHISESSKGGDGGKIIIDCFAYAKPGETIVIEAYNPDDEERLLAGAGNRFTVILLN